MSNGIAKSIDPEVLASYNAGAEMNRFRSDLGLIEFARTCELLLEKLPPAPAVIYDFGGGYGEYSWWLASHGYDVHLFDLSERNIEMARDLGTEYPDAQLAEMCVADARSIHLPDESADAVLLFGPLYHIVERQERRLALNECKRLLKPGGVLFAAGITRYATLLWATTTYGVSNEFIGEPEFMAMVEHELKTGQHIKNPRSAYRGMGRSYFCLPKELGEEIELAGFRDPDIRGVIGPAWLVPNLTEQWMDEARREYIMRIVRLTEREEAIMGLSTHIVAIAVK